VNAVSKASRRRGRSRRRTVEVVGLDHLELAIPRGEEALARLFYEGVLGLQEVRKPAWVSRQGGIWYIGPDIAVHLNAVEAFRPTRETHAALIVADIGHARAVLERKGVPIDEDASGLPVRRCFVTDPFGNSIELIDARDAGFTAPDQLT
jgi:catechol 2,3-dioxygenase-like lactoylglutathione lyase family enzyme